MRRSEGGFTLVGVLIALAVLNVMLSLLVTRWSTLLWQEREREAIWRGQQYARALACYNTRAQRYPTELGELVESGCIRRLYPDPLSASGEWKLLRARDLQVASASEASEAPRQSGRRRPGSGRFVRPGESSTRTGSGAETASSGGEAGDSGFGVAARRTAFRDRLRTMTSERQGLDLSPRSRDAGQTSESGDGETMGGQEQIMGVASSSTRVALLSWDNKRRHDEWRFLGGQVETPVGPWTMVAPSGSAQEQER